MRGRPAAWIAAGCVLTVAVAVRWLPRPSASDESTSQASTLRAGTSEPAPGERAASGRALLQGPTPRRIAEAGDGSATRGVRMPENQAVPTRPISVVDADGRGAAAEVTVFGNVTDDAPALTTMTDDSGRAEVPLALGHRVVALTADGRCGSRAVDAGAGEVRVHVYGPVSLRGRVVDLDTGAPISGAAVRATWLDVPEAVLERLSIGGARERVVDVNANGTFDLAPFRAGRYRLEFTAEGYDALVAEQDWATARDWDMGTITLEAVGALGVQLVGFDPNALPWVSVGRQGERSQVDSAGRASVRVPRWADPQHFSIWLPDRSMMNVYRRGILDEVGAVEIRVGGARSLQISVEGEPDPELASLGRPSIRARYSPEPGTHAEWNRDLDGSERYRTDCIDSDLVAIDLVALEEGWPNVIYSTLAPVAPTSVTEIALRFPRAPRWLKLLGPDGTPLEKGVFVELRRPHDPTRWIASGYTDAEGRVVWPEVLAPILYCGGALEGAERESYFIDIPLPNAPGTDPAAPLALAPPVAHRVRVVAGGSGLAGARVQVVGRHTDQLWARYTSDSDGWTPWFDATDGSAVEYIVDAPESTADRVRVPAQRGETVVPLRGG